MKYVLCCLALINSQNVQAFSLFSYNRGPQDEPVTQALNDLRLNAVYYQDQTQWAFWLNREKITPDHCPENIQVNKISGEEIDITYNDTQVILRVNQSFTP